MRILPCSRTSRQIGDIDKSVNNLLRFEDMALEIPD